MEPATSFFGRHEARSLHMYTEQTDRNPLGLRKKRLIDGFSIFFETTADPNSKDSGARFVSIWLDVDELMRIDTKLAAMQMYELSLAQCEAYPHLLCSRGLGKENAFTAFGYTLRDGNLCVTTRVGAELEEFDTNELARQSLDEALEIEGMVDGHVGWLGQSLLVSASPETFGAFASHMLRETPYFNGVTWSPGVIAEITAADA